MTKAQAERLAALLAEHPQVYCTNLWPHPSAPEGIYVQDQHGHWHALPDLHAVVLYTIGLKLPGEDLLRTLLEYLMEKSEKEN